MTRRPLKVVILKIRQKPTKIGEKSRVFYKKWLYQGQGPFEENKNVVKNCSSMDKVCTLSVAMLNYNLTE